MKKTIIMVLGLMVMAGGLFAQMDTENLNMTVTLKAWYDLNIGASEITFNDVQPAISATPGTTNIAAAEGAITVRAFAVTKFGDTLELSVAAAGDLSDGASGTIDIGAISWTASGSGYVPGTMATTDVTAGSWTGSILHWHEGSFTFSFARDYANQAPGSYTGSATYTLSVV